MPSSDKWILEDGEGEYKREGCLTPGVDYERSSCPSCGDPDCTFPPECQEAVRPVRQQKPEGHLDEEIKEMIQVLLPIIWPMLKLRQIDDNNVLLAQELIATYGPPDVSHEDLLLVWLEKCARGGLGEASQ